MKDIVKSLLTILLVSSAFLIGLHFGKEKEKAKIPKFQDDAEGSV